MKRRKVDLLILSDIHLGTYGCHAKELVKYLKSIQPDTLILNGDIIDMWQFRKKYWPDSHTKVLKQIIGFMGRGTQIHYVTGNHDEMLRKFVGLELGNFRIVNKVKLLIDGKSAWIFHGDVFDVVMQHSKWLAKLGAIGYDTLILINRFVNYLAEKTGRGRISLSKRIKNSVKSAVKFINNFEETAAEIAVKNNFDYVICGHIHQPEMRTIKTAEGSVEYLNSGDWIENLTSLEYHDGEWKIFRYNEDFVDEDYDDDSKPEDDMKVKELFNIMLTEFKVNVA